MKNNIRLINIIIFLLIIQLISSCKVIKVEDNERGVVFKRFDSGVDTTKVYLPGKYKISNQDRLIVYNIDTKTLNEEIHVLAKDEIEIILNISYKFRPIPEKIPQLHFFIGEDYLENIVKPSILNEINKFCKDKRGDKIKKMNKQEIEISILENSKHTLSKKFIELENFKILEINMK